MNKQIKRMDDIWRDIIKARAGYMSEISQLWGVQIGGEHILEAHHIANKPNHILRYDLDNGICLTYGEHRFRAHADEAWGRSRIQAIKGRTKKAKFKDKVRALRGEDIYDKLQVLKNDRTKVDLDEVETFLKSELKKYEN